MDYLNVVLFQFGQDVGLEALQLGRGQRVGLGDHRHQIHFFVQLPHGHHVQHAQSVRRFFFHYFQYKFGASTSNVLENVGKHETETITDR